MANWKMPKRTQASAFRRSSTGIVGIVLLLMLPAVLQADAFGFGRPKPRFAVQCVLELANASDFPGYTFFLEELESVSGKPGTRTIATEKGVYTPIEVDGNKKVIVLAIDKQGRESRSVSSLQGEIQMTRQDLDYILQRLRILSINSGQVNFMIVEQFHVQRGKKGTKFVKAQLGVPSENNYGYWSMVAVCISGLFLFWRMRKQTVR
jgi:hypothetical protein